jgi:hypothetical protein
MKLIILAAFVFTAYAAVEAIEILNYREILDSDRPNYPDVDYYDCTGRHETMETHPFDCTRFMKCDNGRAHDMACPKCHTHPSSCPNGYLIWDNPNQICNWGDQTECSAPPPPTTTSAPPGGDECDENCVEEGDCQLYKVCLGGHWVTEKCDAETWWNSNANGGAHGGACDFWENLNDEQQDKYRDDPHCPAPPLPCYWRPDADCDNKYWWLEEGQKTNKSEKHLSCPKSPEGISLVWNQDTTGCVHCKPEGSCKIC